MRRFVTPIATALVCAVTPAAASASPEAHGGGHFTWFNWPSAEDPTVGFAWVLINFVGLMLVLERLLFKPLRRGHATRYQAIKDELGRAAEAHAKATRLVDEYQTRLAGLDDEIAEIKQATLRRAEADRRRILDDAEVEAEKIKTNARNQAEREAEVRRRQIEDEIVDAAVTKAESLIRQQFGDADQRRLVDTYVDQIGRAPLGAESRRPS